MRYAERVLLSHSQGCAEFALSANLSVLMETGRYIPLTQGYVAVVDEEDFESVSAHCWHVQVDKRRPSIQYARRDVGDSAVFMHQQILGFPKGCEIDHINGNGLDNRKKNLRKSSKSQNHQNQIIRGDSKTGFKGVSRYSNRPGLWRARISVGGKRLHLGCFSSPEEAARAYDEAAEKHFGEYAKLNFERNS